jgi:ubiquinone/menaquinone biosynthesis C-methylase UbiE/uncharacterized protein YbaR (Trm112 family)
MSCPDCEGDIRPIEINGELLGFFCDTCKLIYAVKQGIPILLPQKARNYSLEYESVKNIMTKVSTCTQQSPNIISKETLKEYINNTLVLLESFRDMTSWEWEDEAFWNKEYQKEIHARSWKNWNDRIWQREFLVKHLINETKLNSKNILDVGCGEGQNFRLLISKYCDEATLYIATDISLAALKLNQLRNTHNNSLYILCSADKLPFHKETIDVLCYFGILHHTERKARTISQDSKLVKSGGYILIHEALSRPIASLYLPSFFKPKIEESAHEERIMREEVLTQINNNNSLKIIASQEMHTIFLGAMMKILKSIMMNNKVFFNLILNLDICFMRLFRNIIPFFKPGEIMLLVQKFRK